MTANSMAIIHAKNDDGEALRLYASGSSVVYVGTSEVNSVASSGTLTTSSSGTSLSNGNDNNATHANYTLFNNSSSNRTITFVSVVGTATLKYMLVT